MLQARAPINDETSAVLLWARRPPSLQPESKFRIPSLLGFTVFVADRELSSSPKADSLETRNTFPSVRHNAPPSHLVLEWEAFLRRRMCSDPNGSSNFVKNQTAWADVSGS